MLRLKNRAVTGIKNGEKGWRSFAAVASLLYEAAVRLRNDGYNSGMLAVGRLQCPVISVGNITAGGTGKTPMVIMLAGQLAERGFRPAVLSRGYGGKSKREATVVSDGHNILAGFEEAGDEPVLMGRALEGVPVITGKKRFRTGGFALRRFAPDVLILDDAFQHRSLFRNCDIVLMDGKAPFGNGSVLPKGELREPPAALKRADAIVLTDPGAEGSTVALREVLGKRWNEIPVFEARRRPRSLIGARDEREHSLSFLSGKRILAFAGIAVPERFRAALEKLSGMPAASLWFPDHHRYDGGDITGILETAKASSAELIVTTEKDAVRLKGFPDFYRRLYFLRIELDMGGSRDPFIETILRKLGK